MKLRICTDAVKKKIEEGCKLDMINVQIHLVLLKRKGLKTKAPIKNRKYLFYTMSVCPSFCLKLKISVTTISIGLYPLGNIPWSCNGFELFSWDVGHPRLPRIEKLC